MKTIDITTTQNVTIEYEVATLRERILAIMLDLAVQIGLMILFGIVYAIISIHDDVFSYGYWGIITIIFCFYSFLSELLLNGQTLGKRTLQIRVMKLDGKDLNASDYFVRWAMRIVDVWGSSGTVAAMLISSSSAGQRFGDLAAGTTVVRLRSSFSFQLSEILSISSLENYTPAYPDVRRFTENDMLLIKTALARFQKYPNASHYTAQYALVQRLAEMLDLRADQIRDHHQFLRTLIKDYIVLTR